MILNEILKQDTYDLNLFKKIYIDQLIESIVQDEDKYFIKCLVRNKNIQISSNSKKNSEEIMICQP